MTALRTAWDSATLGELTANTRPICYGVLKPGPFDPSGVPLIRIQDLVGNRVASEGMHQISAELDQEFARSKLDGGEVLLSIQGTVGRTAVVPLTLAGANISRTIAVIRPDAVLTPKLLFFYFQHLAAQHGYETGGTTRASLNISTIRRMRVPVPPPAEQARIVATIEEQFSRIDAATATLERVVGPLNKAQTGRLGLLRAAVLGAAFSEERGGIDRNHRQLAREISDSAQQPKVKVSQGSKRTPR